MYNDVYAATSNTYEEVAEVLTSARSLIRKERHWTKGALVRSSLFGFKYCAIGALRQAQNNRVQASAFPYTEEDIARQLLGNAFHIDAFNIEGWNDSVITTHAQVLHGFDVAILNAKTLAAQARLREELAQKPVMNDELIVTPEELEQVAEDLRSEVFVAV